MERNRRILGCLLLVICILSVLTWERFGRNRFLYKEVLVLNRNVAAGTVITEKFLRKERMENPPAGAIRSGEEDKILGMESVQRIHKNVPLFEEDFVKDGMASGAALDRYVLEIPEHWIESMPRSMAKGTIAVLWMQGEETARVRVLRLKDGKTLEVLASSAEVQRISQKAESGGKFVILEG